MNEEEEFDGLMRSKLSEREFPFDDMNWDEAERLIVKQEKWAKISRFSLIFSAGLIVGVITMIPFILNRHTSSPGNIVSESKTNQSSVSKDNMLSPANQPIVNSAIQSNKKTPNPLSSVLAKNTSNSGKHNIRSNFYSTTKNANEEPSLTSKELGKSEPSNQPNSTDIVVSAENTHKITEHTETTKYEKPNHIEEATVKNQLTDAKQQPMENPLNNKSPANNAGNNSVKTNKAQTSGASKGKNHSSSISPIAKNVTNLKNPKDSNKENTPPLLRVVAPMMDSGQYPANILSVYAGAGYSAGWSNNGLSEANGITPWGGFAFTHYFSRKVAASIGIGYSELTNLNKTYTSSTIQYDFGASTHIITVTPQSVYYLAIPVNIQYNLDDKDKVRVGFDYLMMLTTRSTLSTYQQTYFAKAFIESQTENGYTQGFSNYDIQFTLSYTRMLAKRLGLSIEAYLGLVSVENSSFPGITQFEKNRGGRLVLSYQIFK